MQTLISTAYIPIALVTTFFIVFWFLHHLLHLTASIFTSQLWYSGIIFHNLFYIMIITSFLYCITSFFHKQYYLQSNSNDSQWHKLAHSQYLITHMKAWLLYKCQPWCYRIMMELMIAAWSCLWLPYRYMDCSFE